MQRQLIELDQVYGAKWEHVRGVDNPGADGLSRLEHFDEVPSNFVQEVYAVDHLNRDLNHNFPIGLSLIKSEQDKWD